LSTQSNRHTLADGLDFANRVEVAATELEEKKEKRKEKGGKKKEEEEK
jgi:hypothetical protein